MMKSHVVGAALLAEWGEWLKSAVVRFGSSGYGESTRGLTTEFLVGEALGDDLLISAALEDGSARGLVVVRHARWEESVLNRRAAKVLFLGADTHALADALARAAFEASAAKGVVLLSASPDHSPLFVHTALSDAGFYVAAQALTVRADLDAIAPAIAKIPLRGTFRPATIADAEAIAAIAGRAFVDARFMADPHFPTEWGSALMRGWATAAVNGGADEVIVAESGGEVLGFATMALDPERQARVPVLLGVEPRYDGAGIGVMLVRLMLEWYHRRGVKVFLGETEKSNIKINSLYLRLGFTVLDCNLLYHAVPAPGSGQQPHFFEPR